MALNSDLFKGETKLEDCAAKPLAHLQIGSPAGPHIAKLHTALAKLRPAGPPILESEKTAMSYGPSTAEAVLHYKKTHIPPIINTAYQKVPDKIIGQMTIKFMDAELVGMPAPGVSRDAIADEAFKDSRAALQTALGHLRSLRSDIDALPDPSNAAFGSVLATLLRKHQRNIAVVAKRLVIVADPSSLIFRSGLAAVIGLCERNLALGKTILAAGRTGLCDPTRPSNAGGLPHALTASSQPDPKTHLCEPFFTTDSRDLRRDVVTHEYFHIVGLVDIGVNNANEALRNANTIAQIVAFLADRFRQANSDGQERAVPPLPMP